MQGYKGRAKRRYPKDRALPRPGNTPLPAPIPLSRVKRPSSDAIHLRCPEFWRGKLHSSEIKKWCQEFSQQAKMAVLLGTDPLASLPSDLGPRPFEFSVWISREGLNRVARQANIPATVLLRRIIAGRISSTGAIPGVPRTVAGPGAGRALSPTRAVPELARPVAIAKPVARPARPGRVLSTRTVLDTTRPVAGPGAGRALSPTRAVPGSASRSTAGMAACSCAVQRGAVRIPGGDEWKCAYCGGRVADPTRPG